MGKNKHSLSAQVKQIPDLLKCFICQGEKCEALKSSPLNNLAKSGTLSQNICEFSKISEMPISLIHACSITQNFKELKRDISLPDVPCSIFKIYKKNVLLYQQKHFPQILKTVSSVRIKHPVLNFMKL